MNTQFKAQFSQWNPTPQFSAEAIEFHNSGFTDPGDQQNTAPPNIQIAQYMDGEIQVIDPNLEEMPGHLLVYFPKEKILYGADILSEPNLEKSLKKDTNQFRWLMKYIDSLQLDLIVSGHGIPMLEQFSHRVF